MQLVSDTEGSVLINTASLLLIKKSEMVLVEEVRQHNGVQELKSHCYKMYITSTMGQSEFWCEAHTTQKNMTDVILKLLIQNTVLIFHTNQ